MYWFAGLNDKSKMHKDLYLVALKSAILNTSLKPILIYDGNDEEFSTQVSKNAQIIKHRSLLHTKPNFRKKEEDWKYLAGGAYLRIDIPLICKSYNINDKYVLYTDTDVIFLQNVVEKFKDYQPKYFAICPEYNKDDYIIFNSGVMLINVDNMYNTYNEFIECIESVNYKFHTRDTLDQAALQYFYNPKKVERLPLEFNHKPYWGKSDEAYIIHFHGPKYKNIIEYLNGVYFEPYECLYKTTTRETWIYYKELYNAFELNFNWKNYIDKYPDLRAHGINNQILALEHWISYGINEGRNFN